MYTEYDWTFYVENNYSIIEVPTNKQTHLYKH